MRSHTTIAALFSLLFVGGSVAFLALFSHTVEQKKNELYEIGQREAQASFNEKALTSLASALEATKEDREYITTRILKDEDVIDLLSLIEALGKEEGTTLTTNALTVSSINSTFESLIVGVSVEGSYASLLHLLTLFEQLPYQVSVEEVVFEKMTSEGSQLWRSTYNIKVTKMKKNET